jgi:hypothetical protein
MSGLQSYLLTGIKVGSCQQRLDGGRQSKSVKGDFLEEIFFSPIGNKK